MGIRIDGNNDVIKAVDDTLTIEGISVNTSGMVTATGGVKVGTAATIHSTGQFNIGVAHTLFANGNATHSGIVTASSFYGDGSNLSNITSTTINSNADNRLITGSGTANTLNGETNFTYDGDVATITRSANAAGGLSIVNTNNSQASAHARLELSAGDNSSAITRMECNGHTNELIADGSGNFRIDDNGTERVRIDSAGLIGINTSAPTRKFEISGGAGSIYNFTINGGNTSTGMKIGNYTAASGFNKLHIEGSSINIAPAGSPKMYVQSGGVGIGTENPDFEFTVADMSGAAVIRAKDGANNKIVDLIANSTGGLLRTIGSYPLTLNTNQTDRMTIDSSGNVGITESTPSSKLHVHSPNHYVVTSSGIAHKHIHCSAVNGNAGEYGGAISFGMGATGAAAIAARQGSSDGDVVGLSFFTHESSTASDNAVEKVRLHAGGSVSFNNGILLGNGVSYDSANLMDDYEEGTFTPKLRTIGSSQGEQLGSGQYTKIGNIVHLAFAFDNKNATGLQDNNYIYVTNLPFACNGQTCRSTSPQTYNVNGYSDNQVYFLTDIGATALIGFRTVWNSTWQYWESGYFRGSQIYVRANITYYTDS